MTTPDTRKARITLTPEMMDQLASQKSLYFRVPAGVTMLEVQVAEDEFSQLDRVFSRLWKTTFGKIEKLVK